MPSPNHPLLLTLPTALALAAALAACASPSPTPSPTATPVPSATPTRTATLTPSATATPSTTPSPTPTNRALVALSPTEAAGRALWLVNPRNKPRIAFRYYARMRDAFGDPPDPFDRLSFEHAIHAHDRSTQGDDALVIVAGVEHTGVFEDGLDPPAWPVFSPDFFAPPRLVVIFDAATGLSLGGGSASERDFEALRAIPPARVTPIAGPTRTPTSPAESLPDRATPTQPATPASLWLPGLGGRPVDAATLPNSLREALTAWPLLPGNQWVYDWSRQYYGAWAGMRITETVTAATVLPGDTLVAELRVAEVAAPQTVSAIASGLLDDDPADHPARERISTLWRVVKDGSVYEARDRDELQAIIGQWTDAEAIPSPTPGVSSTPGVGSTPDAGSATPQVILPTFRLPRAVATAAQADMPVDASASDDPEGTEAVTTLADAFDACHRQFDALVFDTGHGLDTNRWLCPGVGVVRVDDLVSRGWSIKQLADYSLEATVDALR